MLDLQPQSKRTLSPSATPTPRISTAEYDVLTELHHWQAFGLDADYMANQTYPGPLMLFAARDNTDNARRRTFARLVERRLIVRSTRWQNGDGSSLYIVSSGAVQAWYARHQQELSR